MPTPLQLLNAASYATTGRSVYSHGLDALLDKLPIGGFSSTADIENMLTNAGTRALNEITDYENLIKANTPYLVKDPVTGKMVQLTKKVPVKQLGPDREGVVIATGPQRYSEDTVSATELRPKGSYAEGGDVSRGIGSLLKEILSKGLEEGTANYLGIPKQDTDWASSIGEKYGLSVSQRDAARHVALGWLASKTDNPELAKFFADAREFRPIAGGPIVSRRMDLENNDIGFNLPAQSKAEAEAMILDLVDKGQVNTDDPSGYADGGQVEQETAFLEALERQRLREEAFDNEFAIEVAAQSNYAADIDPSIARYQGLPDIASYSIPESGPNKVLRGFYPPPDEEYPEGTFLDKYPIDFLYNRKNYRGLTRHTVIPESGTVNAVDKYAKPEIYAHEYRHRNFPGLSERKNRVADLLTALDERQLFEMLDSSYKRKTGSDALDYFRYDLRFERDNPGYGVGSVIFGDEWDRGARSTKQGIQENKDEYIRARIEESPAIKLLNQYEELIEYNEELPEQNQDRVEERQERETKAAVRNYAMGGLVSMAPVARNMFQGYDIRRGVGAYAPYTRRA